MTVRHDLAGALGWSLKFTVPPAGRTISPWSLAGVEYKRGLPNLLHLEQGSFIVPASPQGMGPALDCYWDLLRMLRER